MRLKKDDRSSNKKNHFPRVLCGHKPQQISKDANVAHKVEMNTCWFTWEGWVIHSGADPKELSDCIKSQNEFQKGKISSLDEKAVGGCLRHTTSWRATQTLPAKTKQGEYDAIFIFSMLHQVTSQAVRTSQASENQREPFPPSNSILIKTEKTGLICHNSNTNALVTSDYGKKTKNSQWKVGGGTHAMCFITFQLRNSEETAAAVCYHQNMATSFSCPESILKYAETHHGTL